MRNKIRYFSILNLNVTEVINGPITIQDSDKHDNNKQLRMSQLICWNPVNYQVTLYRRKKIEQK